MGFFDIFKSKKANENKEKKILDFENHLFSILDLVFEFKDAYKKSIDDMFKVFISEKVDAVDYSPTYYVRTGYLHIEILVGNWWDSIIRYHNKELDESIKEIFTFDGHSNFTHTSICTGVSVCQPYHHKEIMKKLQQALDKYEKDHPGIKFTRTDWGASIEF